MNIKVTYLGPIQTSQKNGKKFMEVGAEQFNGEKKSAWDRVVTQMTGVQVGDEIDVELSENGKYINKVTKAGNPIPASGGKVWNKGTSSGGWKEDPEKNVAVYTSYVIQHLLNPKPVLTADQAVDLLFTVREKVKAKLLAKAPAGEPGHDDAASQIKIKTALAIVSTIDPDADPMIWTAYIQKALSKKGGYDALLKDLNACGTGEKVLNYTPDGVPAFVGD